MRKTIKISSEEVQGEDSYVVYKSPRYKLIRELKKIKDEDEQEDKAYEIVTDAIVGWNWSDDEGNPYPIPSDDPVACEEALTIDEVVFLSERIVGITEEAKN